MLVLSSNTLGDLYYISNTVKKKKKYYGKEKKNGQNFTKTYGSNILGFKGFDLNLQSKNLIYSLDDIYSIYIYKLIK